MKKSKEFVNKYLRENRGITLIALVITIVVLLILTMIALNEINGNGIIVKAKEAAQKHEEEKNIETIELAIAEYKMKEVTEDTNIDTFMDEKFGEDNVKGTNGSYIVTIDNKEYLIDNYSNIYAKDANKKLVMLEVENSPFLENPPVATLNTYFLQLDEGDILTFTKSSILINGEEAVTGTLTEEAADRTWWLEGWKIKDGEEYTKISEAYTVTEDLTILRLVKNDSCIAKGSKITMGDGSIKNVEDLVPDDIIMTYSFIEGAMVPKKLVTVMKGEAKNIDIVNVVLENGNTLKILSNEDLYDTDEHKSFTVTKGVRKEIIGKNVMTYNNGEKDSSKIVDVYITTEDMEYYTVYSSESINYIANGMLARFSTCYSNLVFKINDDDKVDIEQLNRDIENYGVYTLEDFRDIATEEEFNDFQMQYLKILEGKGIATKEEILLGCDVMIKELREAKEVFEGGIN